MVHYMGLHYDYTIDCSDSLRRLHYDHSGCMAELIYIITPVVIHYVDYTTLIL